MDLALAILLLGTGAVFFVFFCRRELMGPSILLTPVLLFGGIEAVSVWAAPFYAYGNGVAYDGHSALVVATSFWAFLMGVALARRIGLDNAGEGRRFVGTDMAGGPPLDHWTGLMALIVVLCGAGFYLYRGLPPQVAMFGDAWRHGQPLDLVMTDMRDIRFDLTKAHLFGGEYRGQGAIRVLLSVGWRFAMIAGLVRLAASRNRKEARRWGVRLAGMVVLSLLYLAGDGTRAPFLMAMVQLLAAYSLLFPLRKKTLALAISLGFALILVLSLGSHKSAEWMRAQNPLKEGFRDVAERFFVVNGINNVYIMEFIRSGMLEHANGAIHWSRITSAMPGGGGGGQQSFSNMLAETISGRESTSFATSTYLGTLYMDFGWTGCVVGYFLLGVALQATQHGMFRQNGRKYRFPAWLLLGSYAGLVTMGGWIQVLVNVAVLAVCSWWAWTWARLGAGRGVGHGNAGGESLGRL
jgi:hypothetical protein